MKYTHLLPLSAAVFFAASCANQNNDDFDTTGYEFDDYGTPDGAPYQEVNPIYDSAPAYEETHPDPITSATPPRPISPARAQATHTVVRGDTLWGLSRKYGVPVDAIKSANNMRNDTVVLGTNLVIPAR